MLMEHRFFRDGSGSCRRSSPTLSERTPWQKRHWQLRSATAGTCRNSGCSCRRNWTGLQLRYGGSLSLGRGPGLFRSKSESGTDPFLGVLCNPGWLRAWLAAMRVGGNSTAAFDARLLALLEVTVEVCAKAVLVH